MVTFMLAHPSQYLKGFPYSFLHLSKYVPESCVFPEGSTHKNKPPPIDTQAVSGTERLRSKKTTSTEESRWLSEYKKRATGETGFDSW